MSEQHAPAGWYPTADGEQRYWNGAAWTEHRAPSANRNPQTWQPHASLWLAIAALALGFFGRFWDSSVILNLGYLGAIVAAVLAIVSLVRRYPSRAASITALVIAGVVALMPTAMESLFAGFLR